MCEHVAFWSCLHHLLLLAASRRQNSPRERKANCGRQGCACMQVSLTRRSQRRGKVAAPFGAARLHDVWQGRHYCTSSSCVWMRNCPDRAGDAGDFRASEGVVCRAGIMMDARVHMGMDRGGVHRAQHRASGVVPATRQMSQRLCRASPLPLPRPPATATESGPQPDTLSLCLSVSLSLRLRPAPFLVAGWITDV